MSVECIICCELLQSSETIHHTPCGHVFHQTCLAKWLERSKTCPECRQKVAESKIGRIYLHYAINDSATENTSYLTAKIISLNQELLVKEIEVLESNSNNTKLSTLLKTKEGEVRRLEADLWIAREHHRLWKNQAQMQISAHEISKKEVARLTKELEDLKSLPSGQSVASKLWGKISNAFRDIHEREKILKMISDSQSELMSCSTSRNDLEKTVTRLEQELEIDSTDRMFSMEQLAKKRQLEDDLVSSEIEKIAVRQLLMELNEVLGTSVSKLDALRSPEIEPLRKKLKSTRPPLDVIDLTADPVNPLVDLTEDDDIIS